MTKKKDFKFLRIVLCFALGTMLFAFQSCKKDRARADQPGSLGISTDDSDPSWSPDGTRIVFKSRRDNNREIYIMNADGSNPTRLTDNPAYDGGPSWSPDGQKIAFVSERDGNAEIYIMDVDGSNQMRLTDNPAVDGGRPSWSPDGTGIIFVSERDGHWEIYTMNADGSNQTRLTDNPTDDGGRPSWSPDGTRIIFVSERDGNAEIYIMNADGSNPTRLTDNPAADWWPSWSPDGTRIAFHSNRDGNAEIYIMDVDGSNQMRLTDNTADDAGPSWSPDGQKIAFESGRDFVLEVYVMDADGSNPVNLTNNAPVDETFGSAPLPQSELDLDVIPYRIVFESFRETDGKENWEICLINADGLDFVNLTNTPEINEMYPHASPDGRRICFVADEGEDLKSKSRNVYYMNIDGSDRVKIAENAYQPCWSADGKYIAYLPGEYPRYDPSMAANKSPDGKWFVAAHGGRRAISENAFKADDKTMMVLSMVGCTPDISSDGKRLVWNGEDWNLNIGTLDFDSRQSSVTDHRVVVGCEHEYWVYHADWSPDGNYLTFTYGSEPGSNWVSQPAPGSNICIVDLSTGKWTQVTTDGKHNKEPDWVPVKARRP
jgi:Tol biopolymer transport system component